ncbi:MAG: zinc ribbon domain-containing protein [Raoultibacter sp.]|jgi:RNA polymerase subunit RPABC4/transcription elongation factor Spt4
MNELIAQLWTPELQQAFTIVVVFLVILYVLSIIWVVRDAYLRGSYWYIWAVVALVPLLGVIAYCLLRPPLLQIDRDEQELEIAIKQRELMRYGECANCGYPVEDTYVLCPNCHQQLRNLCTGCGKALDPTWKVCPYCTTPVGGPSHSRRTTTRPRTASAAQSMADAARQTRSRAAAQTQEEPRG